MIIVLGRLRSEVKHEEEKTKNRRGENGLAKGILVNVSAFLLALILHSFTQALWLHCPMVCN